MGWFTARSRSRGQGIVEFALVAPIFLALTFGVIELGWLVYSNHTLTNAAREGARYAMVNGERAAENNGGGVANSTTVHEVVVERAGHLGGNVSSTLVEFSPRSFESVGRSSPPRLGPGDASRIPSAARWDVPMRRRVIAVLFACSVALALWAL
jgi:hypothetical protein